MMCCAVRRSCRSYLPITARLCLQLAVETYFTSTGALYSYYWIGLERQLNQYWLLDGTFVGNGAVRNAGRVYHYCSQLSFILHIEHAAFIMVVGL